MGSIVLLRETVHVGHVVTTSHSQWWCNGNVTRTKRLFDAMEIVIAFLLYLKHCSTLFKSFSMLSKFCCRNCCREQQLLLDLL